MLKNPKSRLYFAYGANINRISMEHRCPQAIPLGPMFLKDWRLEFYNHASIAYSPGSVVPGVLWDLTPDCELRLDAFEGYPYYYDKRAWQQDSYDFFFYVMNQGFDGHPGQGYLDNILEGYDHWRLPAGAIHHALRDRCC
jgi:hypothetical protein